MANVLFLCIGNAGRSQMAHAFLERIGGHEVRSAGSRAEQHLHPEVVEAMDEIGYDLSGPHAAPAASRTRTRPGRTWS